MVITPNIKCIKARTLSKMMTTKNYEFCDDLWREIKSYLFVPRTRGKKCDCCEKEWTRRFAVRETDVWWEGKQVLERGQGISSDGKVRSYSIPIPYDDFPAEVKVGSQNEVKLKHYCDICWCRRLLSSGWGITTFIGNHFGNRFLNTVENNKKNQKIVEKILFGERLQGQDYNGWDENHWLIKKHRLIEGRQLQETATQILEAMIKDYNKITKQHFNEQVKEYKTRLEEAKWRATQRFYTKMSIERFNRDLLKKFQKGEVKYPEFVRLFKK